MRFVIYVDNEQQYTCMLYKEKLQNCMRWAKPDNLHILKNTLTEL